MDDLALCLLKMLPGRGGRDGLVMCIPGYCTFSRVKKMFAARVTYVQLRSGGDGGSSGSWGGAGGRRSKYLIVGGTLVVGVVAGGRGVLCL